MQTLLSWGKLQIFVVGFSNSILFKNPLCKSDEKGALVRIRMDQIRMYL